VHPGPALQRAVLALAARARGARAEAVAVSFDTAAPLARAPLSREYISVNIDSSSLAKGFDFLDPVLTNLVARLAPVLLRIGGTASNGLGWSAAGALPCGSERGAFVVSAACFDTVLAYLTATGARLLFDFGAARAAGSAAWNSSAADALMAHVAARGAGALVGAWQIGNEDPGVASGAQLGADFLTLKRLAAAHGLPDAVIGPSAGGTPAAWMADFCNATFGELAMWSAHTYGGVDCADATGASFVARRTYYGFVDQLHGYVEAKARWLANSTGLLVEETASAAIGGCVNASDRFIDGFYWLTVMGLPAEYGVTQVNRQDVAGWSFLGLESHYALAGPPGWTRGSALLRPHADWFTTVLFKQLMGARVLNFTWSGSAYPRAETGSNVTIHAFCSAAARGGVALAFVVGAGADVTLTVPPLAAPVPRDEFLLTATAAAFAARRAGGGAADAPPPRELWDDAIFLNGERMAVDALGALPAYPIPGRRVDDAAEDIVLPAFSYGFVHFPGAAIAACDA